MGGRVLRRRASGKGARRLAGMAVGVSHALCPGGELAWLSLRERGGWSARPALAPARVAGIAEALLERRSSSEAGGVPVVDSARTTYYIA